MTTPITIDYILDLVDEGFQRENLISLPEDYPIDDKIRNHRLTEFKPIIYNI